MSGKLTIIQSATKKGIKENTLITNTKRVKQLSSARYAEKTEIWLKKNFKKTQKGTIAAISACKNREIKKGELQINITHRKQSIGKKQKALWVSFG